MTSFRQERIIPSLNDVLGKAKYEIPVNQVQGAYASVDSYLSTHFKLIRQDALIPVQNAVKSYCASTNVEDFWAYDDVRLDALVYGFNQVLYRFSFRLDHHQPIVWSKSKQLVPGSLVLLSKDGFKKDIKVATVVDRDEDNENGSTSRRHKVDLRLEEPGFGHPLLMGKDSYVMVQATSGYFEAYRHTLSVIQRITARNLPFKSYLVDLDKNTTIPRYAAKRPQYNLSSALLNNTSVTSKSVLVNMNKPWPKSIDIGMDQSQMGALKAFLGREMTIIQGPPGTGKTFVSISGIKVMLDHFSKLSGPIVCISQTNHALDQFLEHIIKFEPNVVRIGSRSQSETLTPRLISTLRKQKGFKVPRMGQLHNELKRLSRNIDALIHTMYSQPCVGLEFLKNNGLLTTRQLDGLCQVYQKEKYKQDRVNMENRWNEQIRKSKRSPLPTNPIEFWLGPAIMRFKRPDTLPLLPLPPPRQPTPPIEQGDDDGTDDIDTDDDDTDDDDFIDRYSSVMNEPTVNFNHQPYNHKKSNKRRFKCRSMNLGNAYHPRSGSRFVVNYDFCASQSYDRQKPLEYWFKSVNMIDWPMQIRLKAHQVWAEQHQQQLDKKIMILINRYNAICKKIAVLRDEKDRKICQSNRVIGMTSSAANSQSIGVDKTFCKIVEEAAEMMEGYLIASLTSSLEQIIIVGDHQQLRPGTSVLALAKEHHLDVSLFERLVKNQVPYCRLSIQRRMRPEIRKLINGIYKPNLIDHPSVIKYPSVLGMVNNMFIITHKEPEALVHETHTRINTHEAEMVVKYCQYLIKQGYLPQDITIITMYAGQQARIEGKLRNVTPKNADLVKVSSVDGYQGEENKVILLSLVRSNDHGGIGFLNIPNRVCVALSRAKHGLYIFGITTLLAKKSNLWREILRESKNSIGPTLNVRCKNHEKVTRITKPDDFNSCPDGGCDKKCAGTLACGHKCPRYCHPIKHG